MHEETKALKIKRADCQRKPTCFNHQHFDPCKRSTPPPTPMLVSLHLRDGDVRQKSQSQLNNARSSSWPAHLHGDNWQRRHVSFPSDTSMCPPAVSLLFLHSPFFDGVECFFGWQKTKGTLFVLKTFHNIAV